MAKGENTGTNSRNQHSRQTAKTGTFALKIRKVENRRRFPLPASPRLPQTAKTVGLRLFCLLQGEIKGKFRTYEHKF